MRFLDSPRSSGRRVVSLWQRFFLGAAGSGPACSSARSSRISSPALDPRGVRYCCWQHAGGCSRSLRTYASARLSHPTRHAARRDRAHCAVGAPLDDDQRHHRSREPLLRGADSASECCRDLAHLVDRRRHRRASGRPFDSGLGRSAANSTPDAPPGRSRDPRARLIGRQPDRVHSFRFAGRGPARPGVRFFPAVDVGRNQVRSARSHHRHSPRVGDRDCWDRVGTRAVHPADAPRKPARAADVHGNHRCDLPRARRVDFRSASVRASNYEAARMSRGREPRQSRVPGGDEP